MNAAESRPGAAEDRPALAPGTRIGNTYLVLKSAESGSAALCYEGLRLSDQGSVTLFEYFPRGLALRSEDARVAAIRGWESDFDTARDGFIARAEGMTALGADAIVKPIDRIEDLGTVYVVTEAASAPTLSGWASELLRRPSDEDLASIALRFGEAVRALHRAGYGHGAIGDRQLHVATPDSARLGGVLLEPAAAAGTATADVRALAAALYAVVTGRVPPPENRDRSLDARFAALHMVGGDYSEALLGLIDAALEFGEAAEPVDAAVWLDDLVSVSRGILGEPVAQAKPATTPATATSGTAVAAPAGGRERPSAPLRASPQAGESRENRRKNPVALVAAVAVVLIGIAGWLAFLLLGQAPGTPAAPKVAVPVEAPAKPVPPAPKSDVAAVKPAPAQTETVPPPTTPKAPAASQPAPVEPPAVESRPAPQVSVVLPEPPPIPPPPSRPAVTAEDLARAETREAVLALGARGASREAVAARLASLGFDTVVAGGENVFRKAGAGEPWRDCSICPELVLAPPGTTTMQIAIGEKTQQLEFRFERSLAVGKVEVTRGQYAAFARETGHTSTGGCHARSPTWGLNAALSWESPGFSQSDSHPVVCVSFQDALAYAEWLSARTGQRYRLPSDAEWHYLAAAEKWSDRKPDELCAIGNGADVAARAANPDWQHVACDDGAAHTAPVGSYAAGPWGLHDLNGNVWEWVATCAPEPKPDAEFPPSTCPAGAPRLLRGGSWADAPRLRLLDSRVISAPNVRDQVAGFRVVRDP